MPRLAPDVFALGIGSSHSERSAGYDEAARWSDIAKAQAGTGNIHTVGGIVKAVMDYFGYESAAAFNRDWRELTDEDKAQLKEGIANGTLTY